MVDDKVLGAVKKDVESSVIINVWLMTARLIGRYSYLEIMIQTSFVQLVKIHQNSLSCNTLLINHYVEMYSGV